MAKNAKQQQQQNLPNTTVPEDFVSYADFGYQQAKYNDGFGAYKSYAKNKIPGFPDNVADEIKSEIYAGYATRYNEIHPPVRYVREGNDTFIPVAEGMKLEGREVVEIGIHYALAYTQQEYGGLKDKQKNLHAIVGEFREKFRKYRGNCWNALVKKDGNEGRTRSANVEFVAYLNKTRDAMVKRNKTAMARGDKSAIGVELLNQAWLAFFDVLKQAKS